MGLGRFINRVANKIPGGGLATGLLGATTGGLGYAGGLLPGLLGGKESGGGGGKKKKTDYEAKMAALLGMQEEEFRQFKPILLAQMGYIEDAGKVRPMTEGERLGSMGEMDKTLYQKNLAEAQNALLWSQGKGQVPEYIKNYLDENRATAENYYANKLGPGGQYLSTPGQVGMGALAEAEANFLGEYGQKERALGSDLLTSGMALNQQNINNVAAFPTRTSSLMSGYNTAIQPELMRYGYAQQQHMQNEANRAGLLSSAFNLGGQAGGAGLSYLFAASSKNFKKILEKIDDKASLEEVKKWDIVKFKYLPEFAPEDDMVHSGVIAEDAPDSITRKDKKAVNIYDMLSILASAVKELTRQVEGGNNYADSLS